MNGDKSGGSSISTKGSERVEKQIDKNSLEGKRKTVKSALFHRELIIAYLLSIIGDLNYSILVTGCVIYGTKLGGDPSQTGLIGGFYGLTYLFSPALVGKIGDKISRKFSLIVAYLGQVLVSLYFLMIANTIIELIIGQLLMGLVYGFHWPAVEALISENTHESAELHKKGMSNFCIAWSTGFMFGPLIAGILSDIEIRGIFSIVTVVYSIGLLLVTFGIKSGKKIKMTINFQKGVKKDNAPIKSKEYTQLKQEERSNQADKKHTRATISPQTKLILFQVILGVIIYALVSKIIFSYFADYAVRPETLNWSGTLTGTVIFIYGMGRTLYFVLSRFYHKGIFRSSIKTIRNSFLAIFSNFIMLIFIKDTIIISIFFIITGFFIGLIYISSLDLLIVNEKNAKGAVAGIFESAIGFGTVVSPVIAGFLAKITPSLPFIFFAGLIGVFYVISLIIQKKAISRQSN